MTHLPSDEAPTLDRQAARASDEATTDPGLAPPAQAPATVPGAVTPLDKNDRPAGRRFQLFTPPVVGVAQREEITERIDRDPPAPPPPAARFAFLVRRRNVVIALALSAAAGLIVAMQLKLYAIERDRASLPAPSSASVPAASAPPHDFAPPPEAPPRASAPAVSMEPAEVTTSVAPRHVPVRVAPDASPPTSTTAAPTRAPLAPSEPPF